MKIQCTLNKEDIVKIIAEHFNVSEENVKISKEAKWVGWGADEHCEYDPKVIVFINNIPN